MLVKIISGTYGHRPLLPNGKRSPYLNPVKAGSAPIDVDEAEAERLIALGVAAKAEAGEDEAPAVKAAETAPEAAGEPITGHLDGVDLESMSFNDLKALAKDMGIDAGKIKSKAGLIQAITEVEVEAPAEELPAFDAEDVVD